MKYFNAFMVEELPQKLNLNHSITWKVDLTEANCKVRMNTSPFSTLLCMYLAISGQMTDDDKELFYNNIK